MKEPKTKLEQKTEEMQAFWSKFTSKLSEFTTKLITDDDGFKAKINELHKILDDVPESERSMAGDSKLVCPNDSLDKVIKIILQSHKIIETWKEKEETKTKYEQRFREFAISPVYLPYFHLVSGIFIYDQMSFKDDKCVIGKALRNWKNVPILKYIAKLSYAPAEEKLRNRLFQLERRYLYWAYLSDKNYVRYADFSNDFIVNDNGEISLKDKENLFYLTFLKAALLEKLGFKHYLKYSESVRRAMVIENAAQVYKEGVGNLIDCLCKDCTLNAESLFSEYQKPYENFLKKIRFNAAAAPSEPEKGNRRGRMEYDG